LEEVGQFHADPNTGRSNFAYLLGDSNGLGQGQHQQSGQESQRKRCAAPTPKFNQNHTVGTRARYHASQGLITAPCEQVFHGLTEQALTRLATSPGVVRGDDEIGQTSIKQGIGSARRFLSQAIKSGTAQMPLSRFVWLTFTLGSSESSDATDFW